VFCCLALPGKFQRELKLASVVRRGGLACKARRPGSRIAKLVHGRHVCAVEEVEAIGDQIQPQVFAKRDFFCDTQIHLEEARAKEFVAREAAVASRGRSDERHAKRRAVIGETDVRNAEMGARNEGLGGSSTGDQRRPRL